MFRLIILITVGIVGAEDAPVVTTAKGIIRGVRAEDGNYNMFLGIPYAKVDVANPFGASLTYPSFEEVFEANDDSSICPQVEEYNMTIVGDIDCLRLNIYTPTFANTTSLLPVLIYIYGGTFVYGLSSKYYYGPKYLLQHDIILVMINYRVGPYGFMCLDIPEVPGNQGLKDQIMAFRWVQSHILAFGGDPDKVTIGGNSAGSTAVDYHLHRDYNQEKLYNRAILQSGSRLFNPQNNKKDTPIVLARYYDFFTDDVYQALSFLATRPPRDVIIADFVLGLHTKEPCIEKKFPGIENFATVDWFKQKPGAANLSFLIGNSDDEVATKGPGTTSVLDTLRNINIGTTFDVHHKEFQGMGGLFKRFYNFKDNFASELTQIMADMTLYYPNYCNIREFIKNDAAAVYLYNFTYVGKRNYMHIKIRFNWPWAVHSDELGYLFDIGFIQEEITATDQLVIDKVTTLWTNFIKYGDPTPTKTELIDVKWKPITLTSPFYSMNIDSNLALTTSSFSYKIPFWDMFYKQNGHLHKSRL